MTRARDTADTQDNLGGAVAPFVAGKNVLINGAFDIWQRGTSYAATPANFAYLADRWFWIGATASVVQETTIVPTNFQYSMKATATGTSQPVFGQTIETKNCYQLAGKTVTLSAWIATSTAANVTLRIDYSTAADNPSSGTWTTITSTAGSNDVTSTATMTRKSLSFAIPSSALSLRILFLTAANIASGVTFTLAGCQLEEGAVATPFARAGGSIGGELALCQRYYFRNTPGSNYGIVATGGVTFATTTALFGVQFPVPMRIAPTSAEWGNLQLFDSGNTQYTLSAVTVSALNSGTNFSGFEITASGLTVGRPCVLRQNNNAAGFIGFSAEL
jgi:hypothetical protein